MESESGADPYLVDLLEYDRNGWCDCRNFRIEIQPVWERGEIPHQKHCKHIARCRRYLARKIAQERHQDFTLRRQESFVNRLLKELSDYETRHRQSPIRIACTGRALPPLKHLPAKSKKRIAEDEKYFALVTQFKIENPICAVCVLRGRIARPTKDPHHTRGRAGNLRMAVETWVAVCRDCHEHIENNKAWAKEHGLILKWGEQV